MSLPTETDEGNPKVSEFATVAPASAKPPRMGRFVAPEKFIDRVSVKHPGMTQAIVTLGSGGAPNDHNWSKPGEPVGPWAADKALGRNPAYLAMAGYNREVVSRFKGRTVANVVAVQGFWIDVEGSDEKYAKPGGAEGGYPDERSALRALREFFDATGLIPNFLVKTGSGGLHIHYILDKPLTVPEWIGRAKALVKLAKLHVFKIDAQCTTDAARIMRVPGSIHQKTGKVVEAVGGREENYTLEEFDALVKYEPGVVDDFATGTARLDITEILDVNGDVLAEYPAFSYQQAAKKCGAMANAAEHNGRDTPYPVWMLAVKSAELSIEGHEFAHEISRGHPDYDEAETNNKLGSLTGGPAGCEAWETAYGNGGPCESCEFKDQIKNPAIQLGRVVETAPPGSVAIAKPEALVEWVNKLNQRFALVRIGSKMVVVDFETPSMTGRGVVCGFGYLDIAGFHAMMKGRFAPIQKAGDKQHPISNAWLAYPQRRQYEGVVFAPGEPLPDNILNLWQGFAVEPIAGVVTLWLEVLEALVPNATERAYVLRWIAWKIQNPGGVPDTILIFKGAKGAGKNSLFDPLILLFGRHAMLADDPELIAGRFTWHLMSLAFAVLDEAVFIGDPKQADRIKSRVTAKTMHYEQKGMDPVQGVNRCAYVMLTNHEYVWQATSDERRAVVIEVGDGLRGNLDFWKRYHAWGVGDGPAALLHHLQSVDLTGFNPRVIPKGEALRKQVEQTVLRSPEAAWWHQCLSERAVHWSNGSDQVIFLNEAEETEIDRTALRLSYEQSAAARGRSATNWATVARRLNEWAGPDGIGKRRVRIGGGREWRDVLPALSVLRATFTKATQVEVAE